MSINAVKPGRKGYKILFTENTVIMNKKFAAAAAEYGTKENVLLKNIRTDFPGMKEIVVSGRDQKKARTNHRLTYEHMKQYMEVYENADELKEVFKTVQAMSAPLASPYKYVSDWFKEQFPDYKKTPTFKEGGLRVLPKAPPKVEDYKQKLDKVG